MKICLPKGAEIAKGCKGRVEVSAELQIDIVDFKTSIPSSFCLNAESLTLKTRLFDHPSPGGEITMMRSTPRLENSSQ